MWPPGAPGASGSTRIVTVLYPLRVSPSRRSCWTARTRKMWTPSGSPATTWGEEIGVAGSSLAETTIPPS